MTLISASGFMLSFSPVKCGQFSCGIKVPSCFRLTFRRMDKTPLKEALIHLFLCAVVHRGDGTIQQGYLYNEGTLRLSGYRLSTGLFLILSLCFSFPRRLSHLSIYSYLMHTRLYSMPLSFHRLMHAYASICSFSASQSLRLALHT